MADETFQAATYTALGTPREQVRLPADVFDGIVNMPVMHRVVTAYLANQREGNAKTKTRSFVTGGNQKPWRQKGTGRARAGSTRSPLWPGGGTVFVIDKFGYDEPKTRVLAGLLGRMGVDGQKVLILTDGSKPNVYLSGRNLPKVEVLPYSDVSTYHLLWSDVVLIEATAIGHTLTPIVEKEGAPVKRAKKAADEGDEKPARKAKAAPKAKAKAAPKKMARAAAPKKSAAKKTSAPKKKSSPKKKGK
jgi:large subunit ribosomal protein L4